MKELVRDRPIEKIERVEESKPRDERAEYLRFLWQDREQTDVLRALHGLPPLYTETPEEGACSPWAPR